MRTPNGVQYTKCVILNPIRGSDHFVQIPRVTPAVIGYADFQFTLNPFRIPKSKWNNYVFYLNIHFFQYLHSNTLIKYSLSLFYSLYSAIWYFNSRGEYAKTRICFAIFGFNLAILSFVLSIFGFDMQILPFLCT